MQCSWVAKGKHHEGARGGRACWAGAWAAARASRSAGAQDKGQVADHIWKGWMQVSLAKVGDGRGMSGKLIGRVSGRRASLVGHELDR